MKTVTRLIQIAKEKKQLRMGFVFCCISIIFLVLQVILMNITALNLIFLFLIPGISVGAFAFHCLTLTEDRSTMLSLMPMCYLLSLLINELIAVEIGAKDTYPYIPLIEIVPLLLFIFCVSTKRAKTKTKTVLKIWICILILASITLTVMTLFFNLKVTHEINNIKATFAIVSGFGGVAFLYAAMLEVINLAGTKIKGTPFLTRRSSQIEKL